MSKIVGKKYPVDDIISFQDESCFSENTPFHLFNIDAALFLADNVKIDYVSRISGQLSGINCYFEKVLIDGVWDNTTVILHVYSKESKWDTCYFMNNTLYTDNGTRQTPWKFLIIDNGDGTFKMRRAEESTNCIGFANSNTNVAIATNLNPSTASNKLNWRITRDETMKTFLADTDTNLPLINSAINLGWIDQSSTELYAEDVTYLPEYTGASDTSAFKTNQLVTFNELQYCTQITTIPNYCFYNCTTLTSIILPTSVTTIGTSAFSNCTSLSTFDTKNVEIIGKDAFRSSRGLTTLTLGAACTTINGATFLNCSNLSRVNCSSISSWLNITFASVYSTPLYHNAHLYINNVEQTHITIPNNITTIKQYAFNNGRYFQKIIIPETVTTVQIYAFQNCSLLKTAGPIGSGCDIEFGWTTKMPSYAFHSANSLEKVIIPSTFTTIKDRSFAYCTSLKCIDLPESCVTIEVEGLRGCTSLESIAIRAGNINIQSMALTGNTSLRRVYFETSTPPKSTSTFVEISSGEAFVWVPKGSKSSFETFFTGKGYAVKEGEDFTLPLEVIEPINANLLNIAKSQDWVPNEATHITTLDCSQVNDSKLVAPGPSGYEDLETFPELKYFLGITTIPANLFSDSSFLGDIIVPDNVIEIGSGAFHGCGTNSKVIVNNAYIDSDAFAGSNPKEVYLGEDVTLSESNPFTYCPNTKYYVSENNSTLKNSRDNNALIANSTELVSIDDSLLIPQDITTILSCALQTSSSRLGSLILPRNLELIESMAFENQAYNKVFARTEIPADINSTSLNTTIGTLYVPEGAIEEYTNSWGNKFTSIGEIKEFKTQKTIPSIRRDIKAKVYDWTIDYERVTSVMCWGQNLKSYFNIDIPANKVGGFSIFGMNCRDWTATDGFNFLIANEGSTFILGMRSAASNYTLYHYPVWNIATFHSGVGIIDGCAPQRWILSVAGENTIKYNYQSTTITRNVPKGPVTSDAPIRLMISSAYAQNENNSNWLGIKIYETILYGREENGINNGVIISHLIPVKRKSDNRIGFYDLVRCRFFDSVGANFYYERAISPNDGVEYNWSNSPRTSTRNTNWRYGGHGVGKTIQESNWKPGGGLQCAFWYLTRPGKITFHNTYTHGCDIYLENKDGRRTYAKGCPAESTTEWNVNDIFWENAQYLSLVFWDSPTQDEIKNSGWYFTYTDLEIRYDELPQGYTRLEYIEKRSGTAWINTGRSGVGGNLIDLKFSLIVENDTKLPFMVGSVGSGPNGNRNIINERGIEKRNSTNNSITLPVSEEPHTIIMDTRNTTFTGTLDGEKINVTVPSGTIDNNSGNILIFKNNNNGSTAYYGKIYRLKIWLSADIAYSRDLVPCINDQNEVGLFDLVYRNFYGSQTNDTFTAGPIIE